MHYIQRAFYFISLGLEWLFYALRYWLLRIFGSQSQVAGVRVILIREGRLVLVRHWLTPGVWTLPGGGVNKGESSAEAAVREIGEEIGYQINSFDGEVGVYQGRMGKGDSVVILYTEDFTGNMKFLPNLEIMERSLFSLDDLPAHISPGNLRRIEAFKNGVRGERREW